IARITPVPAWTMKAVSVAEPSVCIQLTSAGTLRKRKSLTPPTRPERSSSQSSGYWIAASRRWRRADFLRRVGTAEAMSVGRLEGVEPGLGAVDVLPRAGQPVLVD